MGQTLKNLSSKELTSKTIFDNRFVIEIAEKVHIHYRNLRLNLSMQDWISLCQGCIDAFNRWKKLDCPENKQGIHIELCRKKIATEAHNDGIKVNLNNNLYNHNKEKIFSEGAEFTDEKYIHLKVRDIRLEMPILEFKLLAQAIKEADEQL